MAGKNELVITRIFNAPRSLVWKAWSKPEELMNWWGPKNFTSPVWELDFRVGGKYLFCMRSPDGQNYWATGIYKDIIEYEKIVYTDSFADEKGNVVPGSHYGMGEDFPKEMTVTVTFEDAGGKTKMTLVHAGMPEGEHSKMANIGWNESFDKLTSILK